MSKSLALLVLVACLSAVVAGANDAHFYNTPVAPIPGKPAVTLFDVWPSIDNLLKTQYWYYLRGANTLYEASVDSPTKFLYFTIYRNIVGTFLVITTWTKNNQKTQINTFVRLGNGYSPSSGALYEPVDIKPFIVTLALGPDEYMVVVNPDGTVTVTGNKALYDQAMGLTNGKANGSGEDGFNVTADMKDKCAIADKLNRETYWYYLDNSDLVSESHIPTSTQYYCVFVYVNIVGTFLSISHWDLKGKTAGINTLVRLGNGKAEGANYGPVSLTPAILHMKAFSN